MRLPLLLVLSLPGFIHAADEKVVFNRDVRPILSQHCFACHLKTGGGMVGPNMTDDHWIHGASFADTVTTVTVGVPEKGMISWKPVLKKAEIEAVCSYMYTLRGTKPEAGKIAEGTQVLGSDSPDYRPPAS